MKKIITHTISFDMILTSSETIMFNQGGKFKTSFPVHLFKQFINVEENDNDLDSQEENNISIKKEFILTVELDKNDKHRHDFILKSAVFHLNNLEKEEIEARNKDENQST